MSKKDYIAIAKAFKVANDGANGATLAKLAGAIADRMAEDNALFNRALFLKACKVAA